MHTESMTSFDRVLTTIHMKTPDRVPIAPLNIGGYFTSRINGIKIRDWLFDPPVDHQRYARAVFDRFGGFDIYYGGGGGAGFFSPKLSSMTTCWLNWKLPGFELPVDSLPQLDEYNPPRISEADYRVIVEQGLEPFRRHTFSEVKRRYAVDYDRLSVRAEEEKVGMREWVQTKAVFTTQGDFLIHPMDILSYMRGAKNWLNDLFRVPDDMLAAQEIVYKELVKAAHRDSISDIRTGYTSVRRGSASFISPRLFETFFLPYLIKIVEALFQTNHIVILHMDGAWAPLLHYFRELPKGHYLLQLDHQTSLIDAKEIIGDRMCLMGNVSPVLQSHGSPGEVERYCKRLLEGCKDPAGFILSTGCDTSPDAQFPNIMAMKKAVMKYGFYE